MQNEINTTLRKVIALDIAISANIEAYDDELAETWEEMKKAYDDLKTSFDELKSAMDNHIKQGER
jgi:acyl carrier protein phosphodiesterase